jgi:hypothetical protein
LSSLIQKVCAQPSIIDDDLDVEAAVEGLFSFSSMTFLDDNDILVLEKRVLQPCIKWHWKEGTANIASSRQCTG